jgi:hypothetical protein
MTRDDWWQAADGDAAAPSAHLTEANPRSREKSIKVWSTFIDSALTA